MICINKHKLVNGLKGLKQLSKICLGLKKIWPDNTPSTFPYVILRSAQPFTITPGTWNGTVEFSTDAVNWTEWDYYGEEYAYVSSGYVDGNYDIYLRGINNTVLGSYDRGNFVYLYEGENISLIGNLENLLDYQTVLNGGHPELESYGLQCMFAGWYELSSIDQVQLPVNLADGCFQEMFEECEKLTRIPDGFLPATQLYYGCYSYMFAFCSALTNIPSGLLPATELAEECYYGMFHACSSLTGVSVDLLPATTLASRCYAEMFTSCSSLHTSIPNLPATELAEECYEYMFADTALMVSTEPDNLYTVPYRIPASGSGQDASNALLGSFDDTEGSFTGTPDINVTYYLCTGTICTVTWLDYNGDTLYSQQVLAGEVPTYTGATPTKPSTDEYVYTFSGWSPALGPVTGDVEYTAQFTQSLRPYTVQWLNYDGTLLATDTVLYSHTPVYEGATPTKPSTSAYRYRFVDWDPGIEPVTGDAAYTAVFVEIPIVDPYITFKSIAPFTLRTYTNTASWNGLIEYSTDTITWSTWDGTEISSGSGRPDTTYSNELYLRGTDNTVVTGPWQPNSSSYTPHSFVFNGSNIEIAGDLEVLADYEDVVTYGHAGMHNYCFAGLFANATAITSIADLVLPHKTMNPTIWPYFPVSGNAYYCYDYLFYQCTGLTSLPSTLLPASTISPGAYRGMFIGCTSLVTLPAALLPAAAVSTDGYNSMFSLCTGLTSLPSQLLPATYVGVRGYQAMFYGCTGLTSLPDTLLSSPTQKFDQAFSQMFRGCTGLTALPAQLLPATSVEYECYAQMFYECTGLQSIPATLLPATELSVGCYAEMFRNCTSLTSLPSNLLPATTLPRYCYRQMFRGCSALKVSETLTGEYSVSFRIPAVGAGTADSTSLESMFTGTGGTFTQTPSINTTYYTVSAAQ